MKEYAPKKIYVHELSAPQLTEKLPCHIEYIRTDVFVEMACKWLEENVERHISADGEYTVYYEEIFEGLRNYMKGE